MRTFVFLVILTLIGSVGYCQTNTQTSQIHSGCGVDPKIDNLSDIMDCMWTESTRKPAYIVIAMEATSIDGQKVKFVSSIVTSSTYTNDIKYRLVDRMEERIAGMYPKYVITDRCCDDYASYSCASNIVRTKYPKAIKVNIGSVQ